jgi:hypothetical protein
VELPLEKAVEHAAAAPFVVPLVTFPELGHDVLLPDSETLQPQEKTKKMPHRFLVLQMPHAGDEQFPGRLPPRGETRYISARLQVRRRKHSRTAEQSISGIPSVSSSGASSAAAARTSPLRDSPSGSSPFMRLQVLHAAARSSAEASR